MKNLYDAMWYAERRGLRNEGADVTLLNNAHVSIEEINEFFGPRIGKNGWKYDERPDPDTAKSIAELYTRVTGKPTVCNKTLNVSFARAIVAESKGIVVNWAAYAASSMRFRQLVSAKKQDNMQKKALFCTPSTSLSGGATFCSQRESRPPMSVLDGNVKIEKNRSLTMVTIGGSKVRSGVPKGLCPPSWTSSEIDVVRELLSLKKELACRLISKVESMTKEESTLREEVRVCKLLSGDRKISHSRAVGSLEKLDTRFKTLQCTVNSAKEEVDDLKAKSDSDIDVENVQLRLNELATQLDKNIGILKQLEVERLGEMNYVKFQGERVTDCEVDFIQSEKNLEKFLVDFEGAKRGVTLVETEIANINQQLLKMEVGGGCVLYPLPIFDNPRSEPINTSCTLNACPVCGLWYSCQNHLMTVCGHSYHPWCISEYTRNHTHCLFPGCNEPFPAIWCAAWGFRQGQFTPTLGAQECEELTPTKLCLNTSGSQDITTEHGASNCTPASNSPSSNEETGTHGPFNPRLPQFDGNATTISSKANLDSNRKSSIEDTPIEPKDCVVCWERPSTISIQPCGHANFCFQCVRGRKDCPDCFGPISSWKRVDAISKPKVNPAVFSLSKAFDSSIDPDVEPAKKKARAPYVKRVKAPIVSSKDFDGEGEFLTEDETDSDEEHSGLVRWVASHNANKGIATDNPCLIVNSNPGLSPRKLRTPIDSTPPNSPKTMQTTSLVGEELPNKVDAEEKKKRKTTTKSINPRFEARVTRASGPPPPTRTKKRRI